MINRGGNGDGRERVENVSCKTWDNMRANMKAIRTSKNLTQADLGERMNRGRVFVTELENGRYCPTLALVELVANALEVPVPTLIADTDKKSSKKK